MYQTFRQPHDIKRHGQCQWPNENGAHHLIENKVWRETQNCRSDRKSAPPTQLRPSPEAESPKGQRGRPCQQCNYFLSQPANFNFHGKHHSPARCGRASITIPRSHGVDHTLIKAIEREWTEDFFTYKIEIVFTSASGTHFDATTLYIRFAVNLIARLRGCAAALIRNCLRTCPPLPHFVIVKYMIRKGYIGDCVFRKAGHLANANSDWVVANDRHLQNDLITILRWTSIPFLFAGYWQWSLVAFSASIFNVAGFQKLCRPPRVASHCAAAQFASVPTEQHRHDESRRVR